jgi:hypothetical protein
VAPATAKPAAIDISRLKTASDGSRAGFRAPSCHLKMAGAAPESFGLRPTQLPATRRHCVGSGRRELGADGWCRGHRRRWMSVTFPLTSRVAITSGELSTRLSTAKISWPDACPHQLPACRLQHDALLAHPFEWLHDQRFNHAYRAIHQTLDYCRRSSATGSPAAAVRNSVSCQMRRTSSATLGSPRH